MIYLPAESIDFVDLFDLAEIDAPAVFTSDRDGARLLVAGGYATFLDGGYRGHAIKPIGSGTWTGTVVQGLKLEIDAASVIYDRPEKALLCLERSKTGLYLKAVTKTGNFTENLNVCLVDALRAAPEHQSAFFTRWRCVAEYGDKREEIVTVDTTAVS